MDHGLTEAIGSNRTKSRFRVIPPWVATFPGALMEMHPAVSDFR